MKTYRIYLKKTKQGVFEDVVMIKEGFILWAFLLNLIWLFNKRIFKMAFIISAILTSLFLLERNGIINSTLITPIQLVIFIYIGFEAGDWYEKVLRKRGYKFLGHASGKGAKEARLRFLDKINQENQKNFKVKVF